jgi:amino acid transporter
VCDICEPHANHIFLLSGYDSAVHISEEASNAARAVPMAIVGAISVAGVLGTAIMIVLAFCMGNDLDAIMTSSVNQPVRWACLAGRGHLSLTSL